MQPCLLSPGDLLQRGFYGMSSRILITDCLQGTLLTVSGIQAIKSWVQALGIKGTIGISDISSGPGNATMHSAGLLVLEGKERAFSRTVVMTAWNPNPSMGYYILNDSFMLFGGDIITPLGACAKPESAPQALGLATNKENVTPPVVRADSVGRPTSPPNAEVKPSRKDSNGSEDSVTVTRAETPAATPSAALKPDVVTKEPLDYPASLIPQSRNTPTLDPTPIPSTNSAPSAGTANMTSEPTIAATPVQSSIAAPKTNPSLGLSQAAPKTTPKIPARAPPSITSPAPTPKISAPAPPSVTIPAPPTPSPCPAPAPCSIPNDVTRNIPIVMPVQVIVIPDVSAAVARACTALPVPRPSAHVPYTTNANKRRGETVVGSNSLSSYDAQSTWHQVQSKKSHQSTAFSSPSAAAAAAAPDTTQTGPLARGFGVLLTNLHGPRDDVREKKDWLDESCLLDTLKSYGKLKGDEGGMSITVLAGGRDSSAVVMYETEAGMREAVKHNRTALQGRAILMQPLNPLHRDCKPAGKAAHYVVGEDVRISKKKGPRANDTGYHFTSSTSSRPGAFSSRRS